MNLCFLLGKVASDIKFEFIYNNKNTSIAFLDLILENKSIVRCRAYNEIADYIYSNKNKNDLIFLEGIIKNESIEIYKIRKC